MFFINSKKTVQIQKKKTHHHTESNTDGESFHLYSVSLIAHWDSCKR